MDALKGAEEADLDSLDERGGVPGSARWLRERNEALETERLTLVHQTLDIQVTHMTSHSLAMESLLSRQTY